jgi:hypothetical protein
MLFSCLRVQNLQYNIDALAKKFKNWGNFFTSHWKYLCLPCGLFKRKKQENQIS